MVPPNNFNNMNNNMMFNNNPNFNLNQPMFNMNNNMMPNQNNPNNPNSQDIKKIKLNKIIKIESMIPLKKYIDKYSDKEFDEITQICMTALKEYENGKIKDLTKFCTEKIKEKLNGQWFILIQEKNNTNLEFGFSQKDFFKNIIIFKYSDKIFYVSSLKK